MRIDEGSLMRLTSTIELMRTWRKINALRVPLKAGCYAARCANDASMHPSTQPHFLIRLNTGRSRSVSQERVNISSFESGAV